MRDTGTVVENQDELLVAVTNHLRDTYKLKSEQIDKLVDSMRTTLCKELSNGQNAIAQGDLNLLSNVGHSLKGTLRNMGLQSHAEIAYRIEKLQTENKDCQKDELKEQFQILHESLSPLFP